MNVASQPYWVVLERLMEPLVSRGYLCCSNIKMAVMYLLGLDYH